MSAIRPTAKVPISEAVLFIAPNRGDRDPDLGDAADRAAMRIISAVDYIQSRDSDKQPEWMKASHRLYCPCCVEKGHLSRHKGVKAFEREEPTWNGQSAWMYFPESFQKWPNGPEHHQSCDHANRYMKLTITSDDIALSRQRLDSQLHTVTLPISAPILQPPQRNSSQFGGGRLNVYGRVDTRHMPRQYHAPPLRSIEDIAEFVRENYYTPARWAAKLVKTPEGPRSLAEIFLNTNKDVLAHCEVQGALGRDSSLALVSLIPNRIAKYWEGRNLPSHPSGTLAVLFEAATDEAFERLKGLFNRADSGQGLKVLAYGATSLARDGRPKIIINRPQQVMAWHEPQRQPDLFDLGILARG